MQQVGKNLQRFYCEQIDNGWLLKVTEPGNDKLLGRSAYPDLDTLLLAIKTIATNGVYQNTGSVT